MKKDKIIFWIVTILMSVMIGIGAVFNALNTPESVQGITALGFPAYIGPFLGVAKLAGIIVVLIPGFPRLKEWAYAGLVIDLVGAIYAHIGSGRAVSEWAPILIGIALIMTSYFYHHKLLKSNTAG